MKIVFIHQNFPGQFRRLATALAREGHEVVGLGTGQDPQLPGIRFSSYAPVPCPDAAAFQHRYGNVLPQLSRAYGVAFAAKALSERGFTPDIAVVHTGWGESLFLKEVWPRARIVGFFEFYYGREKRDLGFDPEFPMLDEEIVWRLRVRNMVQLGAFDAVDGAVTPTRWQCSTFPEDLQRRMSVIHDGIDTDLVRPDPAASVRIMPSNLPLDRSTPIVTYIARNLEPYRGVHILFRALGKLLALDPRLHVICVGGHGVSYGPKAADGRSWPAIFRAEVEGRVDWRRVHMTGHLPYEQYLRILKVSAAHLYLTYPFVLSWSLIEAMATEARIVASGTPPVLEIVRPRENGLIFPFFDIDTLVGHVDDILAHPQRAKALGTAARATAVECYDFKTVALQRWKEMLELS